MLASNTPRVVLTQNRNDYVRHFLFLLPLSKTKCRCIVPILWLRPLTSLPALSCWQSLPTPSPLKSLNSFPQLTFTQALMLCEQQLLLNNLTNRLCILLAQGLLLIFSDSCVLSWTEHLAAGSRFHSRYGIALHKGLSRQWTMYTFRRKSPIFI